MPRLLLLAVLLACPVLHPYQSPLLGQTPDRAATGSVRGVVVDGESGAPVPGAEVSALRPGDESPAASAITDARGAFTLQELEPGSYLLEVEVLGYGVLTSESLVVEEGEERVDIGTLRLDAEAIPLEGIAVETERPEVTFLADRSVYHVDATPGMAAGTAIDALDGVLELDVDIDGTVRFEGRTPEIYLNGRPAPMEGEALTVLLEQFPAEMIERVEVIPNPSARYDVEGGGGIVNIVLREDVELGLMGSVFANGDSRGDAGTGGRVTYQSGGLTARGGAFLRYRERERTSLDLRQNLLVEPATYLEQDRRSRTNGLTGSGDFSLRYQATERLLLWTEGRVSNLGSASEGTTRTTRLDPLMEPAFGYERVSSSDEDGHSGTFEAGFELELGSSDHELTGELRRDEGRESGWRWLGVRSDDLFGDHLGRYDDFVLPPALETRNERERETRSRARLDYVRPWGEAGQLEAGYRADLRTTRDRRHERIHEDGSSFDEQTGFTHDQRFHSAYVTLSRRLGPLRLQGGVRGERARTRFTLPEGDAFDHGYSSLFPSANVGWRVADAYNLRFSYSRRARRPRTRMINPIDRSNDPHTRRIGNPGIDPQYTHQVRLDARRSGDVFTLRFAPHYRHITNDWVEVRGVDEEGVATETWENLGSTRAYGVSLSLSARSSGGTRGSMRVSTRQEYHEGGPTDYDQGWNAVNWSVRGNVSKRITANLSAQTRITYSPAREARRGRVPARIMTRAGFRWRVLDGRGSLNVTLRDPLDLYDTSRETRDPTHVEVSGNQVSRRSAALSFSYSLGGGGEGGGRRGGRSRGGGR